MIKLLCIIMLLLPLILFADEPKLVIDPQGHSDMVKDVMFTPDGKVLVSVSRDKTIRLWNVETGDLIKTYRGEIDEGHKGSFFSGALSSDGKKLAVAGYLQRNVIRLINLESGEQIVTLKGHNNNIYALAFSHDGNLLASGGKDRKIMLWDLTNLSEKKSIKPIAIIPWGSNYINDISFAPDGEKLAVASTRTSVGLCKKIEDKWEKFFDMRKHTNEVYRIAFSPDGRYIVSGGLQDRKVILWDGNGNFIKEIDKLKGHINSISFFSNSKKIVAADKGSFKVYVYSIPSGNRINIFNLHNNIVVSSAFYGDNIIATAGGGKDNDIFIWDAISGKVITHIVGKGKPVYKVAFGENLNIAFSNTETLDRSFNFSEMNLNYYLTHKTKFKEISIEYKGKKLKSKGLYKLLIGDAGKIKNSFDYDGEIRSYTFTKEGNIVVGSSFSLKLYKINGKLIRTFIGHTGEIWSVSISNDGKILASASSDQTIKLWNIKTGELLVTLFVATDNEWICWTPQGYYSASAGGEKYIGWHINKGIYKSAEYYPLYVFRDKYNNKDLVIQVIEAGSFKKALKQINQYAKYKIKETTIVKELPPKVEWIYPQNFIETEDSIITIQAKISSNGLIKDIKILLNGRTVATERGMKIVYKIKNNTKWINRKIRLNPGENRISIISENETATSLPETILAIYKVKITYFRPNLYVLSIGISKYENYDLQLEYTDGDALGFAKIMKEQSGGIYNKVEVRELIDDKATRQNIINGLDGLTKYQPKRII